MLNLTLLGFFLLPPLMVQSESPQKLLIQIKKSNSDTNRISFQLKLARYYLSKPGSSKNDLDSANNSIRLASELSNKLHTIDWQYKIQLASGVYYAKKGDLKRCRELFMEVIGKYHQEKNFKDEADAWVQLGIILEDQGRENFNNETIVIYQHARNLYIQTHKPLDAAHVLLKIANLEILSNQYDLAEKLLLQVLGAYKDLHYKNQQFTYERLAAVQYLKGNYYRAVTYASEGIKIAEDQGDKAMAATLYEEIGRYNYLVKNYSEALRWLQKAIALDTGKFIYKCQIISALLALNRTEDAKAALIRASKVQAAQPNEFKAILYRSKARYYVKVHNPDSALAYYLKIWDPKFRKDFVKSDFNYWSMICDNELSALYLQKNQPEKAKKYLDDAAGIFEKTKKPDLNFLSDFYENLYKYNVAIGDYRSAVKYQALRGRLQDSLFNVNKDNKFADLVIRYETAQKEQAIKDLNAKAVVQQARLQTANLQRNITITGILLLVVISGLLYKNYKQKNLANKIITQKNDLLQRLLTEKEWLLKEVHHRVKNNLHTVICLLESQARYLENDALKALETSQHRIFAMSLIHQKLYQSEDIKTINMAIYIPELIQSLGDGFGISNRIRFKLNIQPIELSISHAIPLALIINEVVTNSIKYAFPNNRDGLISISMINNGNHTVLELADDGIGMPPINHDTEPESMGLRLIKGLSEDIDAIATFQVDSGTIITISFKPDKLNNPTISSSINIAEVQQI